MPELPTLAAQADAQVVALGLPEETDADRLRRARIRVMIEKMMDGSMPYGKTLRRDEPRKLSSKHVQILLDKAAGVTVTELAEKYEFSVVHISRLCNHPYAEMLFTEIASSQADNLMDPMARIKSTAHEMINVKLELVRSPETKPALKDKIASDMLDRGGFAPVRQVEAHHEHVFRLPEKMAQALTSALDESREIPADYSEYVIGAELVGSEPEAGLIPSAGHTEESVGASPDASPSAPRSTEAA